MPLRSGEGISGWCAHAAATRWRIRVSARSWPTRQPPKRGKMAHSCECAELVRAHAAATRWRTRISARSWPKRQPPKRSKMAHSCKCAELVRAQAAATRWRIRVSTRSWPARQPLQRTDCARAEPANQPAIPAPAPQIVNGIAQSLSAVYAPVRRNFICKSLSCCNNPY